VLLFEGNEASPYADVNPDRRAAQSRLAALFHLVRGVPFRLLVASATALVRKVVPRDVVQAHSSSVCVEQQIDRDALA
jgi:transcription-repair coupling factor (superfamily II helicase)